MGDRDYNLFLYQLNNKELEAFEFLYRFYYKILVLYSLQFVDQEDVANDLVQEVLISLWEQELSFDSFSAVKGFLYNSVRNRSLNHLKHLKVENRYIQLKSHDNNEQEDIWKEIEEQEIYRQVFAAIEELPPRCKKVFEMHLQGKKNSEIASLLNLSIETVKTQKKRAMRHLRKRMGSLFVLMLAFDILP